jgi:hypothetical protein
LKSVLTALLIAGVILVPAQAQMRGSVVSVPARGGPFAGASISSGEVHNSLRGRTGMRHLYPPFLLGDPYYYADYTSEPVANENTPQVVVVQMPAAPEAATRQTPAEPLLIEWQNDRYVRVGEAQLQQEDKPAPPKGEIAISAAKPNQITKRGNLSRPPHPELQPVVLVYRDGHREQISNYTIADGVLYASGDYWTDGYWNKKILLASLDLSATAHASQEHGAEFILPGSPNEVIIRP